MIDREFNNRTGLRYCQYSHPFLLTIMLDNTQAIVGRADWANLPVAIPTNTLFVKIYLLHVRTRQCNTVHCPATILVISWNADMCGLWKWIDVHPHILDFFRTVGANEQRSVKSCDSPGHISRAS